jgi:hypothetical protein
MFDHGRQERIEDIFAAQQTQLQHDKRARVDRFGQGKQALRKGKHSAPISPNIAPISPNIMKAIAENLWLLRWRGRFAQIDAAGLRCCFEIKEHYRIIEGLQCCCVAELGLQTSCILTTAVSGISDPESVSFQREGDASS